jgi:hypothetical protein
MDGWDFFIPSLGLFIGLNLITCCVGIRRMRLLERRVQALEDRPTSATESIPAAVPYATIPNYVQPTYTFYQQPSAPPIATPYYPQDPQTLGARY